MQFIVSARYDYKTPHELCHIILFLKQFPLVVCYREKGTKSGKPHVHARIEHNINPMAWSRLLKKELPFLFGNAKGHHWLVKQSCYTCISKTHKDPEGLDKKYCLHTSSFTYIAKEGQLVYQKGYTTEQIEEWINIGSSIKQVSQQKLHLKVISYSKLKHGDKFIQISRGILKYYNEIRDIPMPHETEHRLQILADQIFYTLYPSKQILNCKRFANRMSERHDFW